MGRNGGAFRRRCSMREEDKSKIACWERLRCLNASSFWTERASSTSSRRSTGSAEAAASPSTNRVFSAISTVSTPLQPPTPTHRSAVRSVRSVLPAERPCCPPRRTRQAIHALPAVLSFARRGRGGARRTRARRLWRRGEPKRRRGTIDASWSVLEVAKGRREGEKRTNEASTVVPQLCRRSLPFAQRHHRNNPLSLPLQLSS
jgi:hypothetical protein